MADDIDIEEHDLLDNPKIQSIFPDLTIVKKETEEVESNGSSDVFQDSSSFYKVMTSHLSVQTSLDNEVTNTKNKIILGSRPPSNKIILGSKPVHSPRPTVFKSVDKKLQLKPIVKLKDFAPYLNSSKCFCDHCGTLFPNPNDFDSHNMTHHSLLVASSHSIEVNPFTPARIKNKSILRRNSDSSSSSKVSRSSAPSRKSDASVQSKLTEHSFVKSVRNKAVKSVSKNTLFRRSDITVTSTKVSKSMPCKKSEGYLDSKEVTEPCYHCKKTFPNKTLLLEHLYSLLPVPKYNCSQCKKSFPSESDLKIHEKTHLTTLSCNECKYTGRTYIELVHHKFKVHQIRLEENLYYKCVECGFMTRVPLNMFDHCKENHSITLEILPKTAIFDGKCRFCHSTLSSLQSYNVHIAKLHRSIYIKKVETKNLTPKKIIPKQEATEYTGYKCTVCCLIFDSKHKAKYHRQKAHRDEDYGKRIITSVILPQPVRVVPQANAAKLKRYQMSNTLNKGNVNVTYTYKCSICHVILKTASQAKRHRSITHQDIKGKRLIMKIEHKTLKIANIIDKTVMNMQNKPIKANIQNKPVKANMQNTIYKCTVCNFTTKIYYEVRKHRSAKHEDLKGQNIFKAIIEKTNPRTKLSKTGLIVKPKIITKPTLSIKTPIPKSVIFKCSKCQLHFLNCTAASTHLTECCNTDDNWECPECDHSFRPSDKEDHETQHKYTNNFKIYVVHDDILSNLISRCSDCGIYFDEAKFKQHYKNGCNKIPISFLCTDCKLRIDISCKAAHQFRHAIKNFAPADFITMEYLPQRSISLNPDKAKVNLKRKLEADECEIPRKRKRHANPLNLMFCSKCGSCVKSDKKLSHASGKCILAINYLCKSCGIKLGKSSFTAHSHVHASYPGLKLNNLQFFNLHSKKPITKLPVFKYYACKKCNCNFLYSNETRGHVCEDVESVKCKICNNKYEMSAYAVHVPLHSYKHQPYVKPIGAGEQQGMSKNTNTHVSDADEKIHNVSDLLSKQQGMSKNTNTHVSNADEKIHNVSDLLSKQQGMSKNTNTHVSNADEKIHNVSDLLSKQQGMSKNTNTHVSNADEKIHNVSDLLSKYESLDTTWNILYLCSECDLAFDSYDLVVEHCHAHYANTVRKPVPINNCDTCDLNIHHNCFAKHKKLHQNNLQKDAFDIVYYDYHNLLKDNWLDFCSDLPKAKIQQVISRSIYSDIKDVRLRLVKNGLPSTTLYRCDICSTYVESTSVASHAKNYDDCSRSSKKYLCSHCNIPFLSLASKDTHESLHKFTDINIDTCRIVSFNNVGDKKFNLALCNANSKEIRNKKRSLDNVTACLEDKSDQKVKKMMPLRSQVTPLKQNKYNFYKCIQCELCLLNYNKDHVCEKEEAIKGQCPKCKLYLPLPLEPHVELHRTLPDYTIDNFTFALFKPMTASHNERTEETNTSTDELTVYQCSACLLHFSYRSIAVLHYCSFVAKPSVGKCPDCKLEFYAKCLHRHVNDHASKMNTKINVEMVECNNKFKRDSDYNKFQTIFKCSVCSLHFVTEGAIYTHMARDNHTLLFGDWTNCSQCGLKFTRQSIGRHRLLHHKNLESSPSLNNELCILSMDPCKKTKTKEKILGSERIVANLSSDLPVFSDLQESETSKEANTSESKKTVANFNSSLPLIPNLQDNKSSERTNEDHYKIVYKCNKCSLHFVSEGALSSHFQRGNHSYSKHLITTCEHCGLQFTTFSIKRHVDFHDKYNFTIDDVTVIAMDPGARNRIKRKSSCSSDEDEEGNNESTIPQLFKCSKCNIHFTSYSRLEIHVNRNHKDPGSTAPCNFCGLSFSLQTADKHIKLHHSKVKYKLTDFTIRHYTDENGVPIEIEPQEIGDEISTRNKSRKRTSNAATLHSDTKSKVEVKPYKLKLYKCAHCNVHFLEQTKCYRHTSHNHTPLNIREFIECKLCHLQFKLESLTKHIMNDHEGDLNLEEVLVEEYDPNNQINNVPKISIYYAIEKLQQSTVVSTTTYQSEDDKIEDSSKRAESDLDNVNKALQRKNCANIEFIQIIDCHTINKPVSSNADETTDDVNDAKMSQTTTANDDLVLEASCHVSDSLPDEIVTSDDCTSQNIVDVKLEPPNESFVFDCAPKTSCEENATITDVEQETTDDVNDAKMSQTTTANDDLVLKASCHVSDSLPNETVTSDDCTSQNIVDVILEPHNESFVFDCAPKTVCEENGMMINVEQSSNFQKSSDSDNDISNVYQCNYCPKKFKANSSRNIHESLDHIDRLKECPICEISFNESILNDIHLKVTDNKFVCCLCEAHEDICNINEHRNTHKKVISEAD